ncbi:MAG: metallopeptidase family protein [Sphingomonadales bacterium]|jgi:predicted Zn-dependent protease with MMP-like domain|nr:metallopeptidase family protein [Sphingomonadales bacterium]MBK9003665.1 metallopeptidase family protein [Sphingomonadales bacterium]MBK9268839.1 metallopeptidase family protein [Sphingomonadales bacterium]MBP6434945.1 metallopeptidase family protein [Sphingorhabdus sp.]
MAAGDFAPGLDEIERLARAALARIPEPFASHLPDIILAVEDWPSRELLNDMGIADPYELTGLYEGRPVGEKSVDDFATLPDRIFLFRRPLLDEWAETGVSLPDLVNHVVVHEVGHHFGLSDEQMEAIERSME